MLKDEELKAFENGDNAYIQDYFGVHRINKNNSFCYVFRVWAPNAESVSLIGDFTDWFQMPLEMTKIAGGVWEIETDLAREGHIYKYLVTRQGGRWLRKLIPLHMFLKSDQQLAQLSKLIWTKNGMMLFGWGVEND